MILSILSLYDSFRSKKKAHYISFKDHLWLSYSFRRKREGAKCSHYQFRYEWFGAVRQTSHGELEGQELSS